MTLANSERIESHAGAIVGIAAAIDANAGTGRGFIHRQRAAGRPRGAVGVHGFHIDARLDGHAARGGYGELAQPQLRQRAAGGDLQLDADQIEARDLLGNGVLDLKPRIRLDEGERRAAVRILIDEKLDSAHAAVVHRFSQRH